MFSSMRAMTALVRRGITVSPWSKQGVCGGARLLSATSAVMAVQPAPSPLLSGPAPAVRPLDDTRREHFRSQWFRKQELADEADDDFIVFQDCIGDDSNLNWSVVSDRVGCCGCSRVLGFAGFFLVVVELILVWRFYYYYYYYYYYSYGGIV
jgi:hypothetical protein